MRKGDREMKTAKTYYLDSGMGSMKVWHDDGTREWVASLYTELDNGKEVFLDTIKARTKEGVMADAGIRVKECRIGMKWHGQIASVVPA
jgi:hypothetical protein